MRPSGNVVKYLLRNLGKLKMEIKILSHFKTGFNNLLSFNPFVIVVGSHTKSINIKIPSAVICLACQCL